MTGNNLSSVQRALAVLRALDQGPMGVQEVAEHLGREKSQVSRVLKVLSQEGFVERDPVTLRYRIGWQVLTLAIAAGHERLQHEAPAILRALMRRVGEPAYLTVLSGSGAMTLHTERASRGLEAHEWVGRTSPLSCTSAGRALLFDLRDHQVRSLTNADDQPFPGTDSAPRDLPALLARLHGERQRGYTVAVEEYEPGLVATAAPVRDHRGDVVAAINVSAPIFRAPPETLRTMTEAVTSAAADLTSLLAG